ncbi:hypothetical protein FRX31_011855 [Thalictrum thalictroides]|uniref:Uncharacterized protein n=1 Tax=Thalictrum thalictroides TaxID=46969 RepID=A0A7J6WPP1_THATH|nr:hypothetical protein FRX31_011855 [Thalictrum thalictroides]
MSSSSTGSITTEQEKMKEMEEMFKLLLKPEVEQKILERQKKIKEEEWKKCEASILQTELKYQVMEQNKELFLPAIERGENVSLRVEMNKSQMSPLLLRLVESQETRDKGEAEEKEKQETPLMQRLLEKTELLCERVRKSRGIDLGIDSKTKDESENVFTDVLNITDSNDVSVIVDFTTGDDRPWMEYFLTEFEQLEKRKEVLVGLYEEDPVHHAFVLEYNVAVVTPLRAFLVKLLVKRKVWSIVETRVVLFNLAKANKLLVFPVPGVLDICELAMSILKVYSPDGAIDLTDRFASLYRSVKAWVNRTEIFGKGKGVKDLHSQPKADRFSDKKLEKQIVRALHKKDATRFGFIVGDYMFRELSSVQKVLIPLLSVMVWPPSRFAKVVSEITGEAVKQLIYEVPELTEISLLADHKEETQFACLREKVITWVLSTTHLKEVVKPWIEDVELEKR